MQRTLPSFFFLLSVLSLALAPPAAGQISLPLPVVNQNWINIPISLPGGLGGNLTLNFETVTHLSLV
ncbi:MAG TPA: hypothetical protein VMM92_02200, partial [Thermoanaerobaculia bacterium]|nr:hypothetical protein [Thermoanaerobaculia bacterium]